VWKEPKFFFARFAVDADKLFVIHPEYQLPEEQKTAFQRERTACLVGRGLADKYGFNLGDRITLKGDIYPVNLELTVRGIYDDRLNNEVLYFHREYLAESLPLARRDLVGTFNILADAPESVPRIADEVDALFRNSTTQTRTETEQAFQLGFVSFLGNVKMFLLSISAAVTFTILLVSGNTMAMSVRERVREVGILKTLGFTPGAILGIILGEAVCIALIGGALGAGLASLLCGVVRNGPTFLTQLKALTISGPVFLLCLLTAALIGLVSAAVPAWRASRTPILESLRFTG
jgi:putative ABC transport system permease protein